MFCERCSRLLNRATGRCVCDDDPSLAAPPTPPPPPASVVQEGDAALARRALADIAQLQSGSADGGGAGSGVAVLSRPQSQDRSEPIAYKQPVVQARTVTEPGRLRGTIPDLRIRWARFDVRVHEACLVVSKVGGVDPVLAGRVLGLLVLGPLGLLLGDALGRVLAKRQRAKRLAVGGSAASGRDDVLPIDQLVAVTVERLPWGGRVRIGAGGGGARAFRWSKRDLRFDDVAGLLAAAADRRFSMVPSGGRLRVAYRAGVVALLVAALATIAVPVKMIVFPAPPPGYDLPAEARAALVRACPEWRASPLGGAALAATATRIAPDVERAAAAAGPTEMPGLAGAMGIIASFAPKVGSPTAPLEEAVRFSHAVDAVDAACTRVGA